MLNISRSTPHTKHSLPVPVVASPWTGPRLLRLVGVVCVGEGQGETWPQNQSLSHSQHHLHDFTGWAAGNYLSVIFLFGDFGLFCSLSFSLKSQPNDGLKLP